MISSTADMPQNAAPAPVGGPGLSELLRTALDGISEAVIITGPQLERPGPVIEHVNVAFTRMTGYSAEEVVGQSPRILQGPLTDRTVLDHLRSALETREAFQGTAINYRKDGSTYTLHWHITPLRNEAGALTHWIALQREVRPGDQPGESPTERVARVREIMDQALAGIGQTVGAPADVSRLMEQLDQTSRALQKQVRATLALVRSIARRTSETTEAAADDAVHLGNRIEALQRREGAARQSSRSGIDLEWLVADELHAFELEREDRVRISGPPVTLLPQVAEVFSLAVHELTANAVKFGALSESGGSVAVRWRVQSTASAPWLVFRWAERGGPVPAPLPAHKGFGLRLLAQILPTDVNGRSKLRFLPDGLLCRIDIPASSRAMEIT
ncbi:PAS domain-containing protein [Methylobacterium sp. CM6257]|jgi:PAS domain S-box-containing protein